MPNLITPSESWNLIKNFRGFCRNSEKLRLSILSMRNFLLSQTLTGRFMKIKVQNPTSTVSSP